MFQEVLFTLNQIKKDFGVRVLNSRTVSLRNMDGPIHNGEVDVVKNKVLDILTSLMHNNFILTISEAVSMKSEDRIKVSWERGKAQAVAFGEAVVEGMLKDYQEPIRSGTPRGRLIGFSRKKKRAAYLMILHNRYCGLGLKEIAEIARVDAGVLAVWRTKYSFQEEERQACEEVRERELRTPSTLN